MPHDWLKPIADGSNEPEINLVGTDCVITKRCPFSRTWYQATLPITRDQLNNWLGGALIQNAMLHLNAYQREFLITGITPDAWDEAFPGE